MKEIVFVNYEYPPLGGGGGRAMENIALRFAKRGIPVHVVTSSFKDLPHCETSNHITIHRIPSLRRYQEKSNLLEMFVFLISSILWSIFHFRKKSIQAVVAFFTIPSGPAAWVISRLNKCRLIVSLRGGDVPGFMGDQLSLYHKLTKPLINFLWRHSDAVVANSKGLADLARQTNRDLNFKIIPNGIDLTCIKSSGQNEKNNIFTLLSVGRLNTQKSIDLLIHAYNRFSRQSEVESQLLIIGDGPERARLEKIVSELSLSKQVFFKGWLEHKEISHYYLQSHVFVLSSTHEGMPNVILEAMAHSLPIVSTKVEGTEELIIPDLNGYLVPVGNLESLSECFLKLSNNKLLLESMGKKSREIIEKFDWESVVESYYRLCFE